MLPKPVKRIGWTKDGRTEVAYADGAVASLIPRYPEPGSVVTYKTVKPFSVVWFFRDLGR